MAFVVGDMLLVCLGFADNTVFCALRFSAYSFPDRTCPVLLFHVYDFLCMPSPLP